MKYDQSDVLKYDINPKPRATVKRYYRKWREGKGIPIRCDNADCRFHTNDLSWNGAELPLILDHINGNSKDNQPKNLRYLCPNCDSQLPTSGGKNIGRIQNETAGGYEVRNKDGTGENQTFPKTDQISIKTHNPEIIGTNSNSES